MKKRFIGLLLVAVMVAAAVLTGCGVQTPPIQNGSGNQTGNNTEVTPVADEKPVHLKWVGNPTGGLYPDKNSFVVKEIENRFNVDLEIIKAQANKPEEMNLLFASGEIPDHIFIRSQDISMIIGEDLLREIPEDLLKEVAPTYYNQVLKSHPEVLNSIVYNPDRKTFYALPQGQGELFPLTVVRTDWLEKVGAKIPTNLAEFEEICRLFAEEDPDGNSKKDTYAFSLLGNYDVYNLAASFGFSLPAGVVKDDSYLKGPDGKLVKAEVTENYKQLLEFCANLYKKGYIYPDVTIKDDEALFTDGIVGIKTYDWTYLMPQYRPTDWFALTFKKNPNAKTDYVPPLKNFKGEEPVYELQTSVWRWQCVGRNTTDEQLKKILQIIEAQLTDTDFHNLIWRGIEGEHYTVDESGMAIAAGEWGSNEKTAELGTRFFMANYRIDNQRVLSWGREALVQEEFQSNYKVVQQLIPSGTPIETKAKFGADVEKIEEEFFLNTVTGIWDVNKEWDNYVSRWNKAGGEKITAEVNEIYNNLNK